MSRCSGGFESSRMASRVMETCIRPMTLDSADTVRTLELLRDVVTSSRGPASMVKLLQNGSAGHLTVTTASSRLFAALTITKPIVQLIVTSAQGHLSAYSDGGLFVVSLATCLVINSEKSDISCKVLARLFEEFLNIVEEYLASDACTCKMKVPISDLNFMKAYVRSIVSTKPLCKLHTLDVEFVTKLVIEAFLNSVSDDGTSNVPAVSILAQEELDLGSSELYTGLLLKAPELSKFKAVELTVQQGSDSVRGGIKVAVVTVSMSGDMDNVLDVRYETDGDVDMDSVVLSELRMFYRQLADCGVGLLLCQKVVHPSLKRDLRTAGVIVVDRLGRQPISHVLQLTGASPIRSLLTTIPESCYGWLDGVTHRPIHGHSYLHLTSRASRVTTFLLTSQQEETLAELQNVCSTALHSLHLLLCCPSVLAGAGCWQSCVAHYLHCKVESSSSQLQQDLHCSRSTLATATEIFEKCLRLSSLPTHSGDVCTVSGGNGHVYRRAGLGSNGVGDFCSCRLMSRVDGDRFVDVTLGYTDGALHEWMDNELVHTKDINQDDVLNAVGTRNVVIDNFSVGLNAMRTAILTACTILKIGQVIS